jgi:hypothetical protein
MTIVEDTHALIGAMVTRRTRLCVPCLASAATVPFERATAPLRELHRHIIVLHEPGRCAGCCQDAEVYSLAEIILGGDVRVSALKNVVARTLRRSRA